MQPLPLSESIVDHIGKIVRSGMIMLNPFYAELEWRLQSNGERDDCDNEDLDARVDRHDCEDCVLQAARDGRVDHR